MNEPDYAALFEKVGKRKNIVNTSLFISKNKPKKDQQHIQQQANQALSRHSESDMSSNIESLDNYSIDSAKVKQEPLDSTLQLATGNDQPSMGSTLANASKRILGSKLLKKKASNLVEQTPEGNDTFDSELDPSQSNTSSKIEECSEGNGKEGVEVEVDLKELDLPPNTKIFPTSIINSKSRTRGRKENKEADMLDLSKIFLCSYCSRRFKRQEHLKRHFRSLHTFEKPYDCQICHKKFSRLDNLNQHLKIHKQEEEMAAQGLTLNGEPLINGDWNPIKEED